MDKIKKKSNPIHKSKSMASQMIDFESPLVTSDSVYTTIDLNGSAHHNEGFYNYEIDEVV